MRSAKVKFLLAGVVYVIFIATKPIDERFAKCNVVRAESAKDQCRKS